MITYGLITIALIWIIALIVTPEPKVYYNYLRYLVRHKYYVSLECFRQGLYWRGLKHDWTKFLPSEFIPYARFFYGDGHTINSRRDKTGYYKPTDTGDAAFDHAWFLHQKRNDHHWQYWVLPDGATDVRLLPMPHDAWLEMMCDWVGAGRAQGTNDPRGWYLANGAKIRIHPATRAATRKFLGIDPKGE